LIKFSEVAVRADFFHPFSALALNQSLKLSSWVVTQILILYP